ncbi:hypothetical protein COY93_00945 [Candidatus Uhrbacteria bacterium CG_4_10_14_0_8_um_filter_58_22]|uniref:GerMN domain-containing protein n=1 Tax=Candidatus Uhrbacteria bacterium CG_4_10_14_0_8_um_filter_58_22 TaxID=1975029 RepID=A0A2M7QBS3_9BACT|nr:MAG: hypothetical protein AUJ19_03555 [Parcubacteria group bacterium CG1_02_58_44]PIY63233.1 MAG: hypothetical protein COY93_00945 [Candidatus Uhrbacteria bacterium CG_4_10_14_0_8_um_filter_58_22]
MKRLIFVIVLVVVAVLGFWFGRSSLSPAPLQEETRTVNTSYPLLPPPPESEPYVPGTPVDAEAGLPLLLETPVDGAVVSPPFEVSGRALVDQGQVTIAVVDANGAEVFSRRLAVAAPAGEKYGRFALTVGDLGQVGDLILRVSLPESDDPEAVQVRKISFAQPDTVEVQVYFSNQQLDPWVDCSKVFSVKRTVSSRSNIFRAALEALLAGPTENEATYGYVSQLPANVKIKSVGADADGIVTADFDRNLDRGVAGSCRVGAIRAQIEATLRQFPEVKSVVVSVEGEKEGILQP